MANLFTMAGLSDAALAIVDRSKSLFAEIESLDHYSKIETINQIKRALHRHSPFKSEPVDCVTWVPADDLEANSYNPNFVAPVEMQLLELSILEDGYTQPIVTFVDEEKREIVDGFHRSRVGKESDVVQRRIMGYLPVVTINEERADKSDRIASTIRHNRARGKHQVGAMSDIVVELKRRNWSNDKIQKELGMDPDEVLRLCQITGLSELFSDQQFSKSWDVEGEINEEDLEALTDDVETYGEEISKFRTVNTSDPQRIFHTHDKWECYRAGFYATTKEGMSKVECEEAYRDFLSDPIRFAETLEHVIAEWKHSCEHYLTNAAMNRIAWLGQAACCYELGVPAQFRNGFNLLTLEQQSAANDVALTYLNKWLRANGREPVELETAYSGSRQSDLY